VVYRAVGGQPWQITPGTHRAVNLSAAAAGSVRAAGHPACFALGTKPMSCTGHGPEHLRVVRPGHGV
jgi:hypothetical protein